MRVCPVCKHEVKGRADKVYCSLQCKSAQHYERKSQNESFFLQVDRQLKINRKILKKYNVSGYTTLRKEKLLNEGFNPRFFTHFWKNNKGQVYLFCYDYGFMEIEQNAVKKYLLVVWQDYMLKSKV